MEATKLIEAGKVIPIVDTQHYTIETIDDAYKSLETKTAKGKIVIDIV